MYLGNAILEKKPDILFCKGVKKILKTLFLAIFLLAGDIVEEYSSP